MGAASGEEADSPPDPVCAPLEAALAALSSWNHWAAYCCQACEGAMTALEGVHALPYAAAERLLQRDVV